MIKCGLVFFVLSLTATHSFCQQFFEKIYGGSLPEIFRSVIETSDGNIIAGGSTRSFGFGNNTNSDFYLVKTSANGDTLWTRTFGSTSSDEGMAIIEAAGGYIIAGTGYNPLNGTVDFLAGKTDQDGNTIWENYLGGVGADYCTGVIPAPGNKLLFCGSTTSQTNGSYDFYVVETDESGTQMNAVNFGGAYSDVLNRIVPADDGGYLLVGYSGSASPTYEVYIVKIDSDLIFQWSQIFESPGTDIAYDAVQDEDGNYWILAMQENAPDSSEITLIKTDSNGMNAITMHPGAYPGDYAYRIFPVADGYLLTGYTSIPDKGSEMLLMKTDVNGDTLWVRHYGGTKNDIAFSVSTTAGGDIILAGETEGFGTDNFDGYLLRVNGNGDVPCPQSVSFYSTGSAVCEDETVFFVNTTVSSQQFDWKKDGNSFSIGINAAYYFSQPENATVSLAACNAVSSEQVEVFSKPPAYFIYEASGTAVTFFLLPPFSPVSFTWNYGDATPENTTVPEPVHEYEFPGSYWVVFSVTDSHGCDSTFSDQINLITGIDDPGNKSYSFHVMPNPVHNSGEIILRGNFLFPLEAAIYDVSGKLIYDFQITESKRLFTVAGWQSGFYLLGLMSSEGRTIFNKFIVN
jgi:hypothetical protein